MDKIIIVLQDKQTIEKLAADPEVQIRIKDSIIDGIGKRSAKLLNITNDIVNSAKREIKTEFFGSSWGNVFTIEYKKLIKEQAKSELNHLVSEELKECSKEINNAIRSWRSEILKKLEEYDIEKDICEVAEKVIIEKLKK